MDLVNNVTVVNVFNIIGGLCSSLGVTYGIYRLGNLVVTKCCKGKRCVCRVQCCEAIEEDESDNNTVVGTDLSVRETPVPDSHSVAVGPGEVIRNRVLVTNPPATVESEAGETITLIQPPPPRPRYF